MVRDWRRRQRWVIWRVTGRSWAVGGRVGQSRRTRAGNRRHPFSGRTTERYQHSQRAKGCWSVRTHRAFPDTALPEHLAQEGAGLCAHGRLGALRRRCGVRGERKREGEAPTHLDGARVGTVLRAGQDPLGGRVDGLGHGRRRRRLLELVPPPGGDGERRCREGARLARGRGGVLADAGDGSVWARGERRGRFVADAVEEVGLEDAAALLRLADEGCEVGAAGCARRAIHGPPPGLMLSVLRVEEEIV